MVLVSVLPSTIFIAGPARLQQISSNIGYLPWKNETYPSFIVTMIGRTAASTCNCGGIGPSSSLWLRLICRIWLRGLRAWANASNVPEIRLKERSRKESLEAEVRLTGRGPGKATRARPASKACGIVTPSKPGWELHAGWCHAFFSTG